MNVSRVSRDFRTLRVPGPFSSMGPTPSYHDTLTFPLFSLDSQPYLWEKSTLSRGRMNGGKSGGGGGGRFAAESFVGRIPCVGSIRCNNLLCHATESFHESSPPAHTSRRSVGTLCVRQSLPHWIARAGTGGERDLFPFSRRFVVVEGNPVARRLPRFRANFGEGDTALSIFFCRYSFFIEKLKSGSILRDVLFSLSFPFSFSFFGKWIVLCSLVGIVGISSCSLRWKSVDARLYSRVCLGLSIKRIERDTFSGSE